MRSVGPRRRPTLVVLVVACVLVAGCSSDNGLSLPATASSAASSTVMVASSAADTTVAESTATTAAPESTVITSTSLEPPVVDDAPCALTEPHAAITYVVDGRVLELSADERQATCLAQVPASASLALQWSPAGDRLLFGTDTVLDANGARPSGFLATSAVRWSYPTGKALIGSDLQSGDLVWRNSRDGNDQLDISFLARTDVAAYHPAGKNIVAAGVGVDGVTGLYLATNRGADSRVITTLDDPSTSISDIAVDSSGLVVFFVHDHGDVKHIHRLFLQGLELADDATSTDPIGALTLGVDPYSFLAYREGDCNGVVQTKLAIGGTGTPMTAPGLAGRSVSPVGWLDLQRLVVAVRDSGCDGPAEVWIVTPDGSGHQVLPEVEAVSVRTVLSAWGELPDDINAQAPG